MAAPQAGEGSLLAMIVDADTATGLLLTGVGQVDIRKRSNFLIVDDSEFPCWLPLVRWSPTTGAPGLHLRVGSCCSGLVQGLSACRLVPRRWLPLLLQRRARRG